MPKFGYSIAAKVLEKEENNVVKGSLREVRISPKDSIEIARWLKGLSLVDARERLQAVIEKKISVPYKRHNKKVPHRKDLLKYYAGRYPVKAASKVLSLVQSMISEAENRNLDVEKLRIIHASAYGGRKIKRYMPRAFGRASPRFSTLTHFELVAKEVS
ncbi:MAG: 50S ribosomal protein L22 [Candidatus Brockarchaeota archaeon]|nr:50S ribosomal protein L22 [Candidatus Brockarchaeota archaeon]MBO3763164.1 50S ribosomal protein L22 [Candidatus Brockarchaeota archaeon]MBO3768141.1 50S ribosomal protein L22 [Candidatus Brockarchaeota archaeon]